MRLIKYYPYYWLPCCRITLDHISFERDIQLIRIWFPHQMFTLKAPQLKSTMLPSGATAQSFSLSQQIYRFQFAEPKIPYPLGNWRFNLHRTLSEPDWVSLAWSKSWTCLCWTSDEWAVAVLLEMFLLENVSCVHANLEGVFFFYKTLLL